MTVIDEYFKRQKPSQTRELERIRQIVRQTTPAAQEVISYGVPGFKYQNQYLLGFGAFKHHMSLFPTSGPIEVFQRKLLKYKIARGTIQFTEANPLPESLIIEITAYRMQDIETTKNTAGEES